jgi:hypothetical protein
MLILHRAVFLRLRRPPELTKSKFRDVESPRTTRVSWARIDIMDQYGLSKGSEMLVYCRRSMAVMYPRKDS